MVLDGLAILEKLRKGDIEIRGFARETVRAASVPLTLDDRYIFQKSGIFVEEEMVTLGGPYMLKARESGVGLTREFIRLPTDLCGVIYDIGETSRLQVGTRFLPPGYEGNVPLKLYNPGDFEEICLDPGMPICELVIMRCGE